MHRQRSFRFAADGKLEALWERLRARCREEAVTLYARLIARAAEATSRATRKEPAREDPLR
jgi:hypothetical protein